MEQKPRLRGLLIVANYNQAREIEPYITRLKKYWPVQDTLVVDDGSNDASDTLAEKLGLKVVRHPKNLGIGAAIRTGIYHAKQNGYDYVLISSSNGKIMPEEFSIISGPVAIGEADYVTGSRFLKGGSSPGLTPFRRLMIPLFSIFASLIIGKFYTDITCGFRAYKLSVLDDPKIVLDQEWLNRYELEYYIHYWVSRQKGTRIVQMPVTIPYTHLEKGRKSKIKPFTGWWSMVRPFVLLVTGIKK